MFQERICTGSASVDVISAPGVWGTFASTMRSDHSLSRSVRKEGVNGPLYATTPAEMTTSPTTRPSCSSRATMVLFHRTFSPPKPPMSLPARSSWASHLSDWSWRSFFLPLASSSLALRPATLASTSARVSFAAASSFLVTSKLACASARAARLGATCRDTM